jgi:hypothetical protein
LHDKSQKGIDFKQVEWLVGTWENNTSNGKTIESWEKLNDSTLTGKSVLVKDKDTILLETILIVQRKDHLFYIPSVVNQNEGEAIEFQLTHISENTISFENQNHDFPQKITYTKIHNDSLVAEISGISDEKEKRIQFPMKRHKNGI